MQPLHKLHSKKKLWGQRKHWMDSNICKAYFKYANLLLFKCCVQTCKYCVKHYPLQTTEKQHQERPKTAYSLQKNCFVQPRDPFKSEHVLLKWLMKLLADLPAIIYFSLILVFLLCVSVMMREYASWTQATPSCFMAVDISLSSSEGFFAIFLRQSWAHHFINNTLLCCLKYENMWSSSSGIQMRTFMHFYSETDCL